jgi:Flp pilus assembly protein TadG
VAALLLSGIRPRISSLKGSERGSVIVIFAFSLTVLLGFSALAVDLGYARQRSAQAQNSADFAALAGAGVLKTGTAVQAKAEALGYVEKNGFAGANARVDVPPVSGLRDGVDGCIQVKTTEESPAVFSSLFGLDAFDVAARATACATPPLGGQYAVFAGSTTCTDTLSLSGSNRTVNGGVHSNRDINVTSNGTVINGATTYLAGSAPSGNITYNPSVGNPRRLDESLPYPEIFEIEQYAPGGSKALLALSQLRYHYAGSANIDSTWLTLNLAIDPFTKTIAPGLYYTSGDIDLSGAGYNSSGATFVTSGGNIHFNGNNYTFTNWDPDGLLLFSNKNSLSCKASDTVVKLNGNTHSWTGIMYAPRGQIDFAGTNVGASLHGRLVGNQVKLSGSSQTITRNDAFPGKPGGFELVE